MHRSISLRAVTRDVQLSGLQFNSLRGAQLASTSTDRNVNKTACLLFGFTSCPWSVVVHCSSVHMVVFFIGLLLLWQYSGGGHRPRVVCLNACSFLLIQPHLPYIFPFVFSCSALLSLL